MSRVLAVCSPARMGKIDVVFSEKMNEVHERRQREMIRGERERGRDVRKPNR